MTGHIRTEMVLRVYSRDTPEACPLASTSLCDAARLGDVRVSGPPLATVAVILSGPRRPHEVRRSATDDDLASGGWRRGARREGAERHRLGARHARVDPLVKPSDERLCSRRTAEGLELAVAK